MTDQAPPREPTQQMLDAVYPIYNHEQTCINIWRAMYDAWLRDNDRMHISAEPATPDAEDYGALGAGAGRALDDAELIAQAARIAELERDVERLNKRRDEWFDAYKEAERELAQARAEITAQAKEIARLKAVWSDPYNGIAEQIASLKARAAQAEASAEANAKDAERYQTVTKMTMTALNEAHRQASMRDGVRFDDSIDAARRRIAAAIAASAKEQ